MVQNGIGEKGPPEEATLNLYGIRGFLLCLVNKLLLIAMADLTPYCIVCIINVYLLIIYTQTFQYCIQLYGNEAYVYN